MGMRVLPYFAYDRSHRFLNKVDLFVEKLLRSPLSHYWPGKHAATCSNGMQVSYLITALLSTDYTGANEDANAAKDFFKKKFLATNRNKTKEVYCAYTTAIDTNLLRIVMITIQDTILHQNLAAITF